MNVNAENVLAVVSAEGEMVAVIRRDPVTKKNLMYMTSEAKINEMGSLVNGSAVEHPLPSTD